MERRESARESDDDTKGEKDEDRSWPFAMTILFLYFRLVFFVSVLLCKCVCVCAWSAFEHSHI